MSARHPLTHNSRFYILASAIVLSLATASFLRLRISNDQLYTIRLEQFYGLYSIVLLYCAVLLTPLQKLYTETAVISYALFARRAIGVSVAYFALLHTVVALWGQMGGLKSIVFLPKFFQISLGLGGAALLILIALAVTSTDKIIKIMTFRRWKQLHRSIYAGSILILLHVWMIGTHVAYVWVQRTAFIALAIFFALEANRIVLVQSKKHPVLQSRQYRTAAVVLLWLTALVLLLGTPKLVRNYHSDHQNNSAPHAQATVQNA